LSSDCDASLPLLTFVEFNFELKSSLRLQLKFNHLNEEKPNSLNSKIKMIKGTVAVP
jgi:hypothetical protein